MNLIEYHNKLNKNVHYDIDKKKAIFQKSSKCSDNKFNRNAITDKDKTDLSNNNDINGTSNKYNESNGVNKRKKDNQIKRTFYTWW